MSLSIEQLLSVLTLSSGATAVYDSSELRIAFVNQAMLDIWGKTDSIVNDTFGNVFPEFTEQGFTDILLNVWRSGKTYYATDFPADITKDGVTETRYFDFEFKALLDGDGKTYAIVHVATDVTGRMRVRNIVQDQDAVISFNNELGLLTQTLAHDLKNPLCVVKMGVQYLQSRQKLDPKEQEKWYRMILDAVHNVENIIKGTVTLHQARLQGYTRERTPMAEIIRKICQESRLSYNSARCVCQIGQLSPLYGDRAVLYQIFLNLIGNAVKYSKNVRNPKVEVYSQQEGEDTAYIIKDNGIGIPQEDIKNIFSPFFRASNAEEFEGTGVGLFLVKKMLQRLKGDIRLSSEVGRGTTVTVIFPALPEDSNTNERLP